MTTLLTDRRAIREQMRARRMSLPATARLAAAGAIADRLRAHPALQGNGYVAGYWATGGEVPLHALLVPAPSFVYCLPCLQPGNTLRFAPWRLGDPLLQNRYGIPEPDLAETSSLPPDTMDVVLVPLLAFTRTGVRLGAGGGYYDRSFGFLHATPRPPKPLLIGVGYAFQEHALTGEAWDVGLDCIVTEQELIRCR